MKKIFILLICLMTLPVQAISLIQDTEIESFFNQQLKNIFKYAGLDANNAQIALVNDNSINAFVAGGQTVFINTGLILQSDTLDDILFVLSHETGHIVAGHVIQDKLMRDKMQSSALISTILGGLVAIASPEAGMAILMGSQHSALNLYAHYQQTQESAADRVAVDIMHKNNASMQGFSNIMTKITQQERLNASPAGTYLQTHPITKDRIAALESFLKKPLPITQNQQFNMIKAKLAGFLYPPHKTIDLYKNAPIDEKAYAFAIAYFRNHQLDKALDKMTYLIKKHPKNPYFYELAGQFLLENGKIDKAIPYYETAVKIKPNAPLMRLSLAQALLESDDKSNYKKAITQLKTVVQFESKIPFAWQLMASAYEKLGQYNDIHYPMAEYYHLYNNSKQAVMRAEKALYYLDKTSPQYQKAKDILDLHDK